eukprot:EC798093.1.p2 GENE.EC798093.1~~EC798093.1.p2  ORF type:complete len:121 (-),score=7.10 EC798093.1:233-595(-)
MAVRVKNSQEEMIGAFPRVWAKRHSHQFHGVAGDCDVGVHSHCRSGHSLRRWSAPHAGASARLTRLDSAGVVDFHRYRRAALIVTLIVMEITREFIIGGDHRLEPRMWCARRCCFVAATR